MNEPLPDDFFCDCTEITIKRVDEKHPHPAIERDGWFCMGCLQEFIPLTQALLKNRNSCVCGFCDGSDCS